MTTWLLNFVSSSGLIKCSDLLVFLMVVANQRRPMWITGSHWTEERSKPTTKTRDQSSSDFVLWPHGSLFFAHTKGSRTRFSIWKMVFAIFWFVIQLSWSKADKRPLEPACVLGYLPQGSFSRPLSHLVLRAQLLFSGFFFFFKVDWLKLEYWQPQTNQEFSSWLTTITLNFFLLIFTNKFPKY